MLAGYTLDWSSFLYMGTEWGQNSIQWIGFLPVLKMRLNIPCEFDVLKSLNKLPNTRALSAAEKWLEGTEVAGFLSQSL